MQRFTDLKVWQRSHALVLQIYRVTVSRDLTYATAKAIQPLLGEADAIARMLHALRTKVLRGSRESRVES